MAEPHGAATDVDDESTYLLKNSHPVNVNSASDENELVLVTQRVSLPEPNQDYSFSFRRLLAFSGPGLLVSIAYLDPGNIESDLQSGTIVSYKLLWVLLWSTVLGLFVQTMVSRLGVVTGQPMAQLCHKVYPRAPRILLWIMMEFAIIGSDIQEVIGTAIAISLLSKQAIPIYGGVLITLADTFTFLLLENYGLRKLELLFGLLISVMAVTFGYEYVKAKPDQLSVFKGVVIPMCKDCDPVESVLQAVGIVGACIMPHNLYLHSALVKTREVDTKRPAAVKEANLYYLIETGFALFVSFIINLFVVGVFANGLYQKTNQQVHDMCVKRGSAYVDVFPANNDTVEANIYKGGVYLECAYGEAALYIWAVGIFAAGQSSTMTGTYSGQLIMEGFLNLKWKRWLRVLVTRSVAILPTLSLAYYRGIEDLTELNDFMNALMTMLLPFALIPAMMLSNSRTQMGDFANGRWTKAFFWLLSIGVIGINFFFMANTMASEVPNKWYWWTLIGTGIFLYSAFISYLIIFQLAYEGCQWARRLIPINDQDDPNAVGNVAESNHSIADPVF